MRRGAERGGRAAGLQSEQRPQPRSRCDGPRGITGQRVLAWCQHGLDPGDHPARASHPGLNAEALSYGHLSACVTTVPRKENLLLAEPTLPCVGP